MIVLGEVLVVWWQTVVGSGTMVEKSQSNISLKYKTAFCKAMIGFRWSVEKREVCSTCGGLVGRENGQLVCWERGEGIVVFSVDGVML